MQPSNIARFFAVPATLDTANTGAKSEQVGRSKKRVESANNEQNLSENVQIESRSIFENLGNSVVSCVVNVERIEPDNDSGYCGQLNLGRDDEYKLLDLIAQRWGGPAVYMCRPIIRGPDGRSKFGESRRVKIGGTIGTSATSASMPSTQLGSPHASQATHQPAGMPQGMPGAYPYPWPMPGQFASPNQPVGTPLPADPIALLTKAVELLKTMNVNAPGATPAIANANDMAKLVESLSSTVRQNAKPDDGFAPLLKAMKFLSELRSMNLLGAPKEEEESEEASPLLMKLMELMVGGQKQTPAPAPAPPPTMRVPPPPPGFAFDTRTGRYVPVGGQGRPRAKPPVADDIVEDEEEDVEEEEEEEEGEEEAEEPETVESILGRVDSLSPELRDELFQKAVVKYSG